MQIWYRIHDIWVYSWYRTKFLQWDLWKQGFLKLWWQQKSFEKQDDQENFGGCTPKMSINFSKAGSAPWAPRNHHWFGGHCLPKLSSSEFSFIPKILGRRYIWLFVIISDLLMCLLESYYFYKTCLMLEKMNHQKYVCKSLILVL